MFHRVRWVALLLCAGLCGSLYAQAPKTEMRPPGVPRRECFPFESLPPALRAGSEAMLLKALDTEALYTIVGGLKPLSSGFSSFKIKVDAPDLQEIEQARTMLSAWRCGEDLHAGLHHFARVYEDDKTKEKIRFTEGFVFNVPSLREKLRQHAAYFGPFGITPNAHPLEALMAVEYSANGPRWRGYGYLFGFPLSAVDFFVDAGLSQEQTGKFVERDFYSIPTFKAEKQQFVWAVPKGQAETEADRMLKHRAAPILAEYKTRRARYIGEGRRGVVELLRDWFDDGRGRCSIQNVRIQLSPKQ